MNQATPPRVKAAIQAAMRALSLGLSPADASSNWSEEARQSFLASIGALGERTAQGEDIREQCRSIARHLDYWGIRSGPLYESVIAVQRAARGE